MHALSLITLPAQTPIPPQGYDGYAFGSCGAPAHLEVFLDLVCSDCKAIWPTVERVADAYGPAALELTVHTFPLPYHTWAFHAGQSLHAIAAHNRSAVLPWVRLVFANQEKFLNSPRLDNESVSAGLDALAAAGGLLSKGTMSRQLSNATLNEATRVSWKYGASRGVSGTPSFLLNGVNLNADPTWDVTQWKQVIDPVIHPPARVSTAVVEAPAPATCKNGTTTCEYLPNKIECCTPGEFCIPNVGCRC